MSRPPNVLFFFPDQHRPDWLGCNPDLPLRTPNLDRLCDEGVRFTGAWSASPLCAPSRACVASGRPYDRCGVPDNRADYPLDQPTYYQALRDTGYRVAGVGKFDLHKDTSDPTKLDWHLVVNFTGPHNPMDVTASMRARWQDVDFPPPHGNDEPDREGLLRNRQNYAAMIENIDRQVGRFLEVVAERGELDSTIVVYSSDHGEMLGDHGRWGKSTWYTPSAGVPLVIRAPGAAGGRVSDALVCLQDLAATFLDYTGAVALPDTEARSLRPVLEGTGYEQAHRDVAISGLRDWRLVVDGRHKLVVRAGEPDLLFDLVEDPWEDRDLAPERPDVAECLRSRLQAEIPGWET